MPFISVSPIGETIMRRTAVTLKNMQHTVQTLIPALVDRTSDSALSYNTLGWHVKKNKASTLKTHVIFESKLCSVVRLSIYPYIHAQETEWQSGMRSSIMPGLPTPLVQKLNVDTLCQLLWMCLTGDFTIVYTK